METIIREVFVKLHRDKKIFLASNKKFIAIERKRTNGFVIVGVSYVYFNDSSTTTFQYSIPENEWDNSDIFMSLEDYVNTYNFNNISYDIGINSFFLCTAIDMLYPIREKYAYHKPPYQIYTLDKS